MKTAPKKATRIKAGRIQRANYKWIYLFLLPTIVIFAMFYLMPIAQVFVTSFTKWDGFNAPKFNGLTNYINLFTNSSFLIALKNLLWWCVIALTLHVGFGTLVAFVLYQRPHGWKFTRTVFMIPNVISAAAWAMIYKFIFNNDFGILNSVIRVFNPNFNVQWFYKSPWAFWAVTFTWLFYAVIVTLVVLGDLMNIPKELNEAALIDGATGWQLIRYIQLPLCRASIGTSVIASLTSRIAMYEQIALTTSGGPGDDTMSLPIILVKGIMDYRYAGEDRHELNMVFQFELMDVDGGESRKWEPEHPWKLTDIKKIQTRWQTGLDGKAWNSLYWNNHDQPRVVSRFGCTKDEESRVRSAKMLAVCLYLMQGTPYIYQGEELGMTNKHFDSIDPINDVMTRNAYFEKTQRCGESVADFMKAANYISREHTRTPMHWDDTANAGFTTGTPWIPLNPNYPQINAAKQVGDPDSVYSFYRRLLALRKSDKTFVYGHYALLLPDDEEIYAYTRTLNDEQILVVCNFTDHDVPCPLLNDWQNTELLISNYNTPGNPGSLRPFEAVVYRK